MIALELAEDTFPQVPFFLRKIIAVTEITEEAKRQCPKSKKSHP